MPGHINAEGIAVKVNNKLTDMDKAYMVINYPRSSPHHKARDWTLQKALDVAGVPPMDQTDILSSIGDSGTIRSYFASWSKEARAQELGTSLPPYDDASDEGLTKLQRL